MRKNAFPVAVLGIFLIFLFALTCANPQNSKANFYKGMADLTIPGANNLELSRKAMDILSKEGYGIITSITAIKELPDKSGHAIHISIYPDEDEVQIEAYVEYHKEIMFKFPDEAAKDKYSEMIIKKFFDKLVAK